MNTPASAVVASNPQAAPLASGAANGNAPNGPVSGTSGSSKSGNDLTHGIATTGSGGTVVLPQTGHAAPPQANIWTLATLIPLIAAAFLVLAGYVLRRRAMRLG